jgi:hypothetical protein
VIYKWLAIAAISAAIAAGAYFRGRHDVTVVLERERAVHKAEYDVQVAETARVQAAWDSTKERESEINARLEVVTTDSADLVERLRQHSRRRCSAMPATTGSAASPDATSGESADSDPVEVATGLHFAACARDSERLTQFQTFYQSLRNAQ